MRPGILPVIIDLKIHMTERSYEIIKQLNRLVNDRNLAPCARNKLREAVRHIKELQDQVGSVKDRETGLEDIDLDITIPG